MPRRGGKRKKAKTHKEVEVSEAELKRTPRAFVIKRGKIGDRVRDLVKDFRQVMMPNTAKGLKESKINRMEDFVQVAGPLHVSHLVQFSATKLGTYMKLMRLPQGPTLTFKINSFSLSRDVKAAQRRPRQGERDFTSAPLQVLNGFSGNQAERQLTAEMVRGLFPAIDVPTFNHHECRRAVLFNLDKEKDVIQFRQYSVSRKQIGLNRGVSKLMRSTRLTKVSHCEDIADFVLSGGLGASDTEAEDAAEEAPNLGHSGQGNKVGLRLTEIGPRMELSLIKAEEGVCNGAVLYHRFQTKTPTQVEVLEAKARQRKKLQDRNEKLTARVEGVKKAKTAQAKKRQKNEDMQAKAMEDEAGSDSEKEGGGRKGKGGGDGQGEGQGQKRKKFNPFGRDNKKAKIDGGGGGAGTVEINSGPDKKGRRAGKAQKQGGASGGKGKGGGKGNAKQKVLDRMRQSTR